MYEWLRRAMLGNRLSPDYFKESRFSRLFGERLLTPNLWQARRRSVAGGVALGLFIGLTPTMGVQALLSTIAAHMLRVNVPVALAATLITNPFTAPIVYTLEYQIGVWLVGVPEAHQGEEYHSLLQIFSRHARPLFVGAVTLASLCASAGYALALIVWHLRDTEKAKSDENPKRLGLS